MRPPGRACPPAGPGHAVLCRSAQQCDVCTNGCRDWVDWILFSVQLLSLLGTLLAVLLAYRQITQARTEAKDAQHAQLKERRVDFELTVLRELLIAAASNDALRVRALAATLTASVIPLTRAAVRLQSTTDAERVVERLSLPPASHPSSYLDRLKEEVATELLRAIDKRVHERTAV